MVSRDQQSQKRAEGQDCAFVIKRSRASEKAQSEARRSYQLKPQFKRADLELSQLKRQIFPQNLTTQLQFHSCRKGVESCNYVSSQ